MPNTLTSRWEVTLDPSFHVKSEVKPASPVESLSTSYRDRVTDSKVDASPILKQSAIALQSMSH